MAVKLGKHARKLDLALIENGERVECPDAKGVFFTLYPWATHNPRFRQALQARALKESKKKRDVDVERYVSDRQQDGTFIAEALIGDIEGLLDENDEPIEYTPEVAAELLSDPELAHVRDWVVGYAHMLAGRFKQEVEDSGNDSRPASSGKKGGAAKSRKTRS